MNAKFMITPAIINFIINMQLEIQKAQYQQPNFIYGGVRYNLKAGNWRQMKFKSNYDFQQYFLNLQELEYAIMKKSIFTFASSTSNSTLGALYSYNFINEEVKQWRSDEQSNVPPLRKKYGLIAFDGRLCMFGGVHENKYLNDLNSFCSYSFQWTPVVDENSAVKPSPRIPYVFCEVQNSNILLFGGFNESGFIKDGYLLVNRQWKQLKIINKESMENKFGFIQQVAKPGIRYCSSKNGIYFFGGISGPTFTNEFYLMKINYQNFTLKIDKVKSDNGPRPCQRAFHAMQKIGEASIAVYGGIHGNVSLRDLSIFDLNKQKWTEVFPLNNSLISISQPKMYFEMSSILLMGIISEKNLFKKALFELKFPEFQIIKSEICSNCIKRLQFKQKQELNTPKKPFVSNGLIYNMAAQLNFPFQAIALLLDCAETLKATQISITSEETNNKLTYFDIRFNGNNLTRQQYSSIISHSYLQDPIVIEIIDKIKLGSMRLGKTLIYVEVVGENRRVFLFSADSLIISHYHQLYAYFSYEQRISDEWLSTQESIMHKKFIMNLLRSYFVNPSILINSVKSHCFLIFQSNVIMTSEKIYYGELISSPVDITQCKNNKKVQFLDSIGFSLSEQPEVSLGKYLQYLYLNPSIKEIKVQSTKIRTCANKYLIELDKLESARKIRALYKQRVTVKTIEADCNIYEVVEPSVYIKQLKGVYIYYRGRLINRLDINFGDLFWQKFFKAKYRREFGIWAHVGVINILKGLQPKSLKNEFKNQSFYSYFIRELRKQRMGKFNMRPDIIDVEEDEVRVTKGSKKQKN